MQPTTRILVGEFESAIKTKLFSKNIEIWMCGASDKEIICEGGKLKNDVDYFIDLE